MCMCMIVFGGGGGKGEGRGLPELVSANPLIFIMERILRKKTLTFKKKKKKGG